MAGCYNATLLDASPEDVTPVGAIPGTEVGDKRILHGASHRYEESFRMG